MYFRNIVTIIARSTSIASIASIAEGTTMGQTKGGIISVMIADIAMMIAGERTIADITVEMKVAIDAMEEAKISNTEKASKVRAWKKTFTYSLNMIKNISNEVNILYL